MLSHLLSRALPRCVRASASPTALASPLSAFCRACINVFPHAHSPCSAAPLAARASFHASAASEARILAADPIDKICGEVLKSRKHELTALAKTPSPAELIAMIPEYEGLIVRSGTTVTKEIIEAGKKLKVIGRAGVGVDNVDIDEATRR